MDPKKIFEPYAKAALFLKDQFVIIEGQYNSEKDPLNKLILKKQMETFKSIINETFRQTGDFVPTDASKKALEYCEANSLGDIFAIGYNEQKVFEKKNIRKECRLKYEHKIPVDMLVNRLIECESHNDALNIFLQQEIVWVHKDEDKLLPQSNRLNPDEEYEKAGIEVEKNNNLAYHLFYRKIKKNKIKSKLSEETSDIRNEKQKKTKKGKTEEDWNKTTKEAVKLMKDIFNRLEILKENHTLKYYAKNLIGLKSDNTKTNFIYFIPQLNGTVTITFEIEKTKDMNALLFGKSDIKHLYKPSIKRYELVVRKDFSESDFKTIETLAKEAYKKKYNKKNDNLKS